MVRRHVLTIVFLVLGPGYSAISQAAGNDTVQIDVNLNLMHILGEDTTLDRNRFVAMHEDADGTGWSKDNAIPNLRDHFLNGYDVYLGRNTGSLQWNMNNQVSQDPYRPGFANPASIASTGQSSRTSYAAKAAVHPYEFRNDMVLCAQLHPFYPDGQLTNKGWAFSTEDSDTIPFGTASGEYMGRYIKEHFGNGGITGKPTPTLLEIVNEPVWHLIDYGTDTLSRIFRFHNAVASEVRKFNPGADIAIGGYCTAFPDHDKREFAEWTERWKLFMDIAGENMDFWAIHLYDFPSIGGKQKYRKGSNMEATFDMMEQYSYLKFGVVKPFMISEFGAQMHDYKGAWSAYRDWLHMKSVHSMMMQFIERSNIINKTLNFLPLKAEWGTENVNDTYNHRLMRRENEPVSLTGDWIYTPNVQTYQLWSDVKGIRVDTRSKDLDLLVDAYVDGNRAYVVVNNLEFTGRTFEINLAGPGLPTDSIKVKHQYLYGQTPVLDEFLADKSTRIFSIGAEATMVLEYPFTGDINPDAISREVKYYADTYFKPIHANVAEVFTIHNVETGPSGEAVLRLGTGRSHGKSLSPEVLFNGTRIEVPSDYRGGSQSDRDNFFGVLELDVPWSLIKDSNTVSVRFHDDGGHISSLAMQTFKFSEPVSRSWEVPVTGLAVTPDSVSTGIGQSRYLDAWITPENATMKIVSWESADTSVASVDANSGVVTGKSAGTVTVTATSLDGGYMDSCIVTVQNDPVVVAVDSVSLSSSSVKLFTGARHKLIATVWPRDAENQSVSWTSTNESVALVSSTGLITARTAGSTQIKVTTADGGKTAFCDLTVEQFIQAFVSFDNESKYLDSSFRVGDTLTVSCNYHAGSGRTVGPGNNGIKYYLRQIRPVWKVEKDVTVWDESVIGTESGTSSARIPLTGLTPTAEIPKDNFYYLFLAFKTSDGTTVSRGIKPIQIIDSTTSVSVNTGGDIRMYPVPVKSHLIVELDNPQHYHTLEVISVTGEVLIRRRIQPAERVSETNVSTLKKGFYILRLSGTEVRTAPFVKY